MYAAKVRVGLDGSIDGSTNAAWEKPLSEPLRGAEEEHDPLPNSIEFTSGNPRVEHTTGVVHLYKQMAREGATALVPALPVSPW